jgi:hypothetical protein
VVVVRLLPLLLLPLLLPLPPPPLSPLQLLLPAQNTQLQRAAVRPHNIDSEFCQHVLSTPSRRSGRRQLLQKPREGDAVPVIRVVAGLSN